MDNDAPFETFGKDVDNAFYFVVDKVIDIQKFFIGTAWNIGYVVLLIAVFSAAFNHALTGQGLKENVVKILKAVAFFVIILGAYPAVVGFITSYAYKLAHDSVYPSVKKYFEGVTVEIQERNYDFSVSTQGADSLFTAGDWAANEYRTFTRTVFHTITKGRDDAKLFADIERIREHPQMTYTTVAPAAVIKIIYLIAGECIQYADNDDNAKHVLGVNVPEISRVIKGLVCAGVAMFTGVLALIEYLVCFIEFMLVASVGVILFPLSLWEGSKFMAEKFIGAILGFFIKLLFCNLAIFLLLYGFISLYPVSIIYKIYRFDYFLIFKFFHTPYWY
jgi:hypothetical protein